MHVCIDFAAGSAIFVIHEEGDWSFVDVPQSGRQQEELLVWSTDTTSIKFQLGENELQVGVHVSGRWVKCTVHISGRRSAVRG